MDRESNHSGGSNTGGRKLVPKKSGSTLVPIGGDTVAAAKQEEWTTSRKVVNHKTKQVETRVQRQIIMEDGKVIADSGPQVTTKCKEDQKQEETENTNHKNIGDIDTPPGPGYVAVPGANQVVSEKVETHQSMREAKEENMQYHDESLKELTGLEVHRKALHAPNDLIKIDSDDSPERPKGKLVHYSSKSHKINDSEEVKETSRLARDGTVTTETTRTHHHEEFDDDELPEDNPEVKALPAASTETTRNVEYLKDYEDGFDNFPKAMNRQNQNARSIEVEKSNYNRDDSRRSYFQNEENVRNTSTTSRWLDDHFGSDESDIVETSNTRTGNNVINVTKSGRTYSPVSAYSGEYHSIDRSKNVSHHQKLSKQSSPQKYTTTATYYVKDSRTPSPRSSPNYTSNEYYVRPSSRFREDASVQASLSDEDDGRINDFRTSSHNERKERYRVSDVRSSTPSRPEKTFYFGDNEVQQRNYKNDRQDYQNTQRYSSERDSRVKESLKSSKQENYKQNEDWKESGYLSSNRQTRVLSTLNDKVINDSTTNQNFERSFKDDIERSDFHQSFDRLVDKTWAHHTQNLSTSNEENQYGSSARSKIHPIEYIHPVIQDDSYSGRRDPSIRQRNFDSYTSPPPLYSEAPKYSSNGTSQNKDYKYNYSSSPSPPSSPTGGTWTKSKGRTTSPLFRSTSPGNDFPQFSPLTSPLEIKNFTDSYTNGKNY